VIRAREDWQRVTKRRPCPVCGKPDWCLYAGPADAPTAAICARVESPKRAGEAGWLHKLRDTDDWRPRRRTVRRVAVKPDGKPIINFGGFARQCHLATHPDALRRFAASLGLSAESLRQLGVGWSPRHGAWTFPMSDANGQTLGIRLRLPNGRKLAVKGGKEGLFVPSDLEPGGRLLLPEGPTDTAALLDLGLAAVGRPSCSGGTRHVVELAQRLQPAEAVIVADHDEAGQRGADRLASTLAAYVPTLRVIRPPNGIKDARAWKASGATSGDVTAEIEAAPVRRLGVRVQQKAGGHNGRR